MLCNLDITMQVKTWVRRQAPSTNKPPLMWLLKLLLFISLALLLSVTTLLLTSCVASPCQPSVELKKIPILTSLNRVADGAISNIGVNCKWGY